jgi:hypothetical protein
MRKTRQSARNTVSEIPRSLRGSRLPLVMRSAIAGVAGAWFVVVLLGGFSAWTVRLRPRLVWTLQGFEPGVPHGAGSPIWIGGVQSERASVPWHQGEIEWVRIHSDGDPTQPQGIALPLDEILPPGVESYACTVRSVAFEESKLMLCPATYRTTPHELVLRQEARCILPTYTYSLGATNSSIPIAFSRLQPSDTHLYIGSTGSPINQALIDLLVYDVTALARYARS